MEETTEFTRAYLEHLYGDRVRVEYLAAARPAHQERAKALLARVSGGYTFYPLVFIDGELEMAGSAEYYEVLYAVREALSERRD